MVNKQDMNKVVWENVYVLQIANCYATCECTYTDQGFRHWAVSGAMLFFSHPIGSTQVLNTDCTFVVEKSSSMFCADYATITNYIIWNGYAPNVVFVF